MVEFPMVFWLSAGGALLLATLGIHFTLRRAAREEKEQREKQEKERSRAVEARFCPFQEDCPWLRGEVESCAECTVRPTGCPGTGECVWRAVNVHACDDCPCGFVPRGGGKDGRHGRDT